MRTSVVLLLAAVALAAASVIPERTRKVADKDFLAKQKDILRLLIRVHQPIYVPDIKEVANTYDPEANLDHYKDPAIVKRLLVLLKNNELLPRHTPFAVVSLGQFLQTVHIFDVLISAVDYQTFYKTAVYLRERVNEGQYVYALSLAVLRRPDTKDIILPPPYEIYPEMFVNSEIIHEATEEYLQGKPMPITVNAWQFSNKSAWYQTYPSVVNEESLLKYFTEDVALNAYHTYFNFEYPSWYLGAKYNEPEAPRRGEVFFYYMQQILNRYQLERLSNGLKPVEQIGYYDPTKPLIGFAPQLVHHNGVPVPTRPDGTRFGDTDLGSIQLQLDLERHVSDSIDRGYAYNKQGEKIMLTEKDGVDILGNIVQGTNLTPLKHLYGSIYFGWRMLVGHVNDPTYKHGTAPGPLEHYETTMRDPAYYRILARLVDLIKKHKFYLRNYKRDQLAAPGLKIESVDVDKLVTYVDDVTFDINSAIDVPDVETAQKVDVRVRVPRLNHKPFSVKVTVNSDKAQRVSVRFFLAPKWDVLGRPLSMNEKRSYVIEIDRFPYDVQAGSTVIERSSRDSTLVGQEHPITRVLLKKVEDGLEGREPFYIDSNQRHCGFPENLLLPKGTRTGNLLQLYVVVSTYSGDSLNTHPAYISCGAGYGYSAAEDKPLGWPFDRPIYWDSDFNLPNIYAKDVIIFHKKQEDINKA